MSYYCGMSCYVMHVTPMPMPMLIRSCVGLVAMCIFLTLVAEKIIHSAEVGAFLSGILISSSPKATPELTARALKLFEPIRDMFAALFFSSIGQQQQQHTTTHSHTQHTNKLRGISHMGSRECVSPNDCMSCFSDVMRCHFSMSM